MPLLPRTCRPAPLATLTLIGPAMLLATLPLRAADAPVYRCGNSYSATPCPGAAVVEAADARTPEQQREAREAHRREAALADQLSSERRARELAAQGQRPARIGPATTSAPPQAASRPKAPPQKKAARAPKPSPKPRAAGLPPREPGQLGAL